MSMLCACYAICAQEVVFALSLMQAQLYLLPVQEVKMVTKMSEIPLRLLQRSQTYTEVIPVLPQDLQALTRPKRPGKHPTSQTHCTINH